MQASTRISKRGRGGQEAYDRGGVPVGSSGEGKCMMLWEWRPQEVGDTRNVDYLPRKAVGREWNQPLREVM
jgi:hypothetical protein